MKKILGILLSIAIVAAFVPAIIPASALEATSGWGVGADGKYHVTSATDLLAFGQSASDFAGQTVVLDADIVFNDMTAAEMKADGTGVNVWTQSAATFSGTFDGQGHFIKGLYSKVDASAPASCLFGDVNGAVIKDLSLIESYVYNWHWLGSGLVSKISYGSRFENVYVSGILEGRSYLGGFCNLLEGDGTQFVNCWFDGSIISAESTVGGFAGQVDKSVVFVDCLNTGSISVPAGSNAGGFVSNVEGGSVDFIRCVFAGTVAVGSANGWAFCAKANSLVTSDGSVYDPSKCAEDGNSASYYGTSISGTRYAVSADQVYTETSTLDSASVADGGDGWGNRISGSRILAVPSFFATDKVSFAYNSADGKWHIACASDLLAFGLSASDFAGQTVVLDADIVFNDKTADEMKADGTGLNEWVQNTATFSGTFDGQGHSIKGLYSKKDSSAPASCLFSDVNGAVIKDFCLTESYVYNWHWLGSGLVSKFSYGSRFENVYVSGILEGRSYLGGFCNLAEGDGTQFINCWFDGTIISAESTVGGYVGQVDKSVTFTDCLFSGSISVPAGSNAAGFVSNVEGGSVDFIRCVSAGGVAVGSANGWAFCAKSNSLVTSDNCWYIASRCAENGDSASYYGTSISGTRYSMSADSLYSAAASLGSAWGYRSVGGSWISVPVYFADSLLVDTYKASGTAPAETGKVFAGWYLPDGTAFTGSTGSAIPRFVDENVMSVKAQASATEAGNLRFLSTVDCLDYTEAGFIIRVDAIDWTYTKQITNVYRSVNAAGSTVYPSQVGCDDSAFITFAKLTGIPDAYYDSDITVTTYWVTADGTTVTGATRTVTYNQIVALSA
ncbi:MAG: hypothetical protein IJV00_07325 [Clostridia bacterium]|nr:hypothetical protein [Clostridia bacterium]